MEGKDLLSYSQCETSKVDTGRVHSKWHNAFSMQDQTLEKIGCACCSADPVIAICTTTDCTDTSFVNTSEVQLNTTKCVTTFYFFPIWEHYVRIL